MTYSGGIGMETGGKWVNVLIQRKHSYKKY